MNLKVDNMLGKDNLMDMLRMFLEHRKQSEYVHSQLENQVKLYVYVKKIDWF